MKEHNDLLTSKSDYDEILKGNKTFTMRANSPSRDFHSGDLLNICEVDNQTNKKTGRSLSAIAGHIDIVTLPDGDPYDYRYAQICYISLLNIRPYVSLEERESRQYTKEEVIRLVWRGVNHRLTNEELYDLRDYWRKEYSDIIFSKHQDENSQF
jgi:hypothetical protein